MGGVDKMGAAPGFGHNTSPEVQGKSADQPPTEASITRVGVVGTGPVARALAGALAAAGVQVTAHEQVPDRAALADRQLVVEVLPDQLAAKAALISQLDDVIADDAVIATTTSTLMVSQVAAASVRPQRVVGMHLPTPELRLAEVAGSADLNSQAVVLGLLERLAVPAIRVGDRPGFISARLLYGYLAQAVRMSVEYASPADIDTAMRLGCGYPSGPLELVSQIGRDELACGLANLNSAEPGTRFAQLPRSGAAATPPAPNAAQRSGIRRVGVLGTGTMGSGIAGVCALAGLSVVLAGRSEASVERALLAIDGTWGRAQAKGRLTPAEAAAARTRITPTTGLEAVADVDLVIEAVAEDVIAKESLFARLGKLVDAHTLLASTTSSMSVSELAQAAGHPERVVGLHFFNPASAMRLVEVVSPPSTAHGATARALAFCRELGKTPVACGDRAGFIVNALLFPYLNDAVRMAESGYADADQIDYVMKQGIGFPMGPFELLDVVGLDVSAAIMDRLATQFGDPSLRPATTLVDLVLAGQLGRKTGRGLRVY